MLSPISGFRRSRRIARALWTLSASETRRTSPTAVPRCARYFLPSLPIRLSFAFGCIGKAVRARRHHARYTIPESVADILQPCLAALIFDAVVEEGGNGEVFVAAVLQDGRGDRQKVRDIR